MKSLIGSNLYLPFLQQCFRALGLKAFLVNRALSTLIKTHHYYLVKDVTLKLSDSDTTQIDHVLVSRYGIFVIETKNMQGWIFGSPQQKQWKQRFRRSQFTFQNPLHQNYKHIKSLESIPSIKPETLFSVIAFVGGATLKTPMPEDVTHGRRFIDYIRTKTTPVYSDDEVMEILGEIEDRRMSGGLSTNRTHRKNIRSRLS